MADPPAKLSWTSDIVSVVILMLLGLTGLHEQRTEGEFRFFFLPGWPTYALMWIWTFVAIMLKARQQNGPPGEPRP